eukprot:TRINITY_DN7968_c0_g2_i10.p1 TRINITY_DN7968_c0_g2~~TRINITY_DN7968_c0_g2_i10.p1  ORF type:complete len:714 (+),score=40.83 TRINITY_DN7968_c0_g2_i10:181-2322(+)
MLPTQRYPDVVYDIPGKIQDQDLESGRQESEYTDMSDNYRQNSKDDVLFRMQLYIVYLYMLNKTHHLVKVSSSQVAKLRKGKNRVKKIVKAFAIFFPEQLRRHVPALAGAIGGIIVAMFVTATFSTLFFWQQCIEHKYLFDESNGAEQSEQGVCIDKLLTLEETLGLDIHGHWSNNRTHDKIFGGPWNIKFKAYEGNDEQFYNTVSELTTSLNEYLNDELGNDEFFDILEQVFFYSNEVNGNKGSAQIEPSIDIQTIFHNYDISGFAITHTSDSFEINPDDPRYARVNSDWDVLQTDPCKSDKQTGNQNWVCKQAVDYPTRQYSEHHVQGLQVGTNSSQFDEILTDFVYPGSRELFQNGTLTPQPFYFEWNFAQIFAYDYCNHKGREQCQDLLKKSASLEDKELQDFLSTTDWPYFSVTDFVNILNQFRTFIPTQGSNADIARSTVYSPSLQQCGMYLGDTYIFRPENIPPPKHDDDDIENGVLVEYVMIPQLSLATPSPEQTSAQGSPYYVCESCSQRQEYFNKLNGTQGYKSTEEYNKTLEVQEICKKSMYVFFHVYAFVFRPTYGGEKGLEYSFSELTISKDYVTTLLYRLNTRENMYSQFTSGYDQKKQVQPFYYNQQQSQIQGLHCDTSEWRFKDDIKVDGPFTLTTGVKSCTQIVCPTFLQRLADAMANTQLLYFGLLLVVILLLLFFVPKVEVIHDCFKEFFENAM